MQVAEVSGYVAAVLVFMTFYMKTMIPLRIVGICSNCAFIMYGYLDGLYPVLILHLILLPLNSLRLREMLKLIKQVREATGGDPNMDWIKPFTSTRHVQPGPRIGVGDRVRALTAAAHSISVAVHGREAGA